MADAIQSIKDALGPFIKPREQAAYVRRVLTLHLESHLGPSAHAGQPLALADGPTGQDTYRDIHPSLHRDYLKSLAANAAARQRFAELASQISSSSDGNDEHSAGRRDHQATAVDYLQQHAAIAELRQKKASLEVLQKHMDALSQMAVASPSFLDAREVFAQCAPLPVVPRTVMESFTIDHNAPKADLRDLTGRLEKIALRAKLQLEEEEYLLREARARTAGILDNASLKARLHALNTTRNELIGWIEAELSRTAQDDEDAEGTEPRVCAAQRIKEQDEIKTQITGQLLEIRKTYAEYCASRKALLDASTSRPVAPAIVTKETSPAIDTATSNNVTPTYLLTPYIEALLALSQEQKVLVQHRSHINALLSKQARETLQTVGHLADESQLLSNFANNKDPSVSAKPKPRTGSLLENKSRSEVLDKVSPWVNAADTAKLATLEAVAEKIEESEVALGGSMDALKELHELFGRDISHAGLKEDKADETQHEDDVWLAAEPKSRIPSLSKGNKKKHAQEENPDIWGKIDGTIGIRHGR